MYLALNAENYDACIINDCYISCNGLSQQMLKNCSKG